MCDFRFRTEEVLSGTEPKTSCRGFHSKFDSAEQFSCLRRLSGDFTCSERVYQGEEAERSHPGLQRRDEGERCQHLVRTCYICVFIERSYGTAW